MMDIKIRTDVELQARSNLGLDQLLILTAMEVAREASLFVRMEGPPGRRQAEITGLESREPLNHPRIVEIAERIEAYALQVFRLEYPGREACNVVLVELTALPASIYHNIRFLEQI